MMIAITPRDDERLAPLEPPAEAEVVADDGGQVDRHPEDDESDVPTQSESPGQTSC